MKVVRFCSFLSISFSVSTLDLKSKQRHKNPPPHMSRYEEMRMSTCSLSLHHHHHHLHCHHHHLSHSENVSVHALLPWGDFVIHPAMVVSPSISKTIFKNIVQNIFLLNIIFTWSEFCWGGTEGDPEVRLFNCEFYPPYHLLLQLWVDEGVVCHDLLTPGIDIFQKLEREYWYFSVEFSWKITNMFLHSINRCRNS